MIIDKTKIENMLAPIFDRVAYSQFSEDDVVRPPFAVWYWSGDSNNLHADGSVYVQFRQLTIEIYCDTEAQMAQYEAQVEAGLHTLLETAWEKESQWIQQEQMFETLYYMEVLAG